MATLFEQTGFNATDAWNNYSARILIPASFLSGVAAAIQVKMAYYNNVWSFAKAYIGHRALTGDAYDFDGNQVQLTFSGSAGGTVGAGGLLSDVIKFNFDETRDIIVSLYLPSSVSTPKYSISGITTYGLASVDNAADSNVTGYTGYSNQIQMVYGIYSVSVAACYLHARRDRLNMRPISTQNSLE